MAIIDLAAVRSKMVLMAFRQFCSLQFSLRLVSSINVPVLLWSIFLQFLSQTIPCQHLVGWICDLNENQLVDDIISHLGYHRQGEQMVHLVQVHISIFVQIHHLVVLKSTTGSAGTPKSAVKNFKIKYLELKFWQKKLFEIITLMGLQCIVEQRKIDLQKTTLSVEPKSTTFLKKMLSYYFIKHKFLIFRQNKCFK